MLLRDEGSGQTNFPREVAEMALAHTVGDKVEAAYRRGDLSLPARRPVPETVSADGGVGALLRDGTERLQS